jgi:N-terminal domain of toast_rack, DUF2154/Domain of unknown function (DUF5668)
MPVNDRQPKTSLVMPILLISVGVLFLLKTWYPGFDPFQFIKEHWKYWPLVLILVGLGKIWDASRNRAAAPGERNTGVALGSTIGVVAFVFVVVILLGHYQKARGHETHGQSFSSHAQQTIELQGAKSVSASLHMGAGQLNVSGGSGHLLNAEFHFDRKWDNPIVDYHVSDGKGLLDVSQDSGNFTFGPSDNTWDLDFSDEVPLDLRVDMGAGQGNLKLRGVDVTNVELHVGAGQVIMDLTGPRKSDLSVSVKGGVGQVTVRLPKDVGVTAHATGGIGAVRTEGLHKNDGDYTNDTYGKTPHKIRVDVEGGIGEIELIQEP